MLSFVTREWWFVCSCPSYVHTRLGICWSSPGGGGSYVYVPVQVRHPVVVVRMFKLSFKFVTR